MIRISPVVALTLTGTLLVFGQQAGPTLSIDAAANRHAISPDIYGINFFWNTGDDDHNPDPALLAAGTDVRATTRRWGGNGTSTYHWKWDVNNIDADWFYEVLPDTKVDASKLPEGSAFNRFADRTRTTGGKMIGTIPVLGWLPKARQEMCSYDVSKYGKQCKQDPYAQYHPVKCGNGIVYVEACGDPAINDGKGPSNPTYLKADPNDAYAPADENLQADWVRYLVSRYGKANQGGVTIYALDNEPIWWDSTHRDIHPDPYSYNELLAVNTRYAAAIKKADPTALVSGPVSDNFSSLWLSKKDIAAGWARGNWFSNQVDRTAHGGMALMPWYLDQMRQFEQAHGTRLLDYVDVHAYLHPSAVETDNQPNEADSIKTLRLDSTRVMWDPSYVVSNDYWIKDPDNNGAPIAPMFIPRLKQVVAQYYPGTKIAITEYQWHGQGTINGALAQAELLGIFGREGLDAATLWGPPRATDPVALAFKFYRNYDGAGGAFGDNGVQAASADQSKLSVYAALRNDLNLTAVVINKTNGDLTSTVNLGNFAAADSAKVWRYSGASLTAIVAQPDAAVNGYNLTATFPANSMTMLAIPPASLPVAKPSVAAVTNAASYSQTIAPGQMVVVWGTGLGPATLTGLSVESNGTVSIVSGNVRVLFDGVPAPMVYASATQCSAIVPYFGATKATTHLQVEFQGVRSDAMVVPVAATAPGLFSADFTGKGQGAILNEDNVTRNSPAKPATPGSLVIVWGTGEGLTDPPGVDARPAIDVLPKPLAAVTVSIGGLPAKVEYAGAAPYAIPGLLQVNARVPSGVTPGDNVPVKVTVGTGLSQDGITIAVR